MKQNEAPVNRSCSLNEFSWWNLSTWQIPVQIPVSKTLKQEIKCSN